MAFFPKATKGSAATGNYPIALQLLPSVKDATLSVVILRDRLHQASLQLPQVEVGKFGEVFHQVFSMRKHHGTRNFWNI